jgi:hypothetical protein
LRFLVCGVALDPFVAATSTGASSSVHGGDERDESESTMLAVDGVDGGCGRGRGCGTREQRRSTAKHV